MTLRWLIGDFTPRRIRLSGDERRTLRLNAATGEFWDGHRARFGVMVAVIVFIIIAAVVGCVVVFATFHDEAALFGAVFGLAVAAYMGMMLAFGFASRPIVLACLRRMGHPLCVRCAYDLEGLELDSDRCPECGADLGLPGDVDPSPSRLWTPLRWLIGDFTPGACSISRDERARMREWIRQRNEPHTLGGLVRVVVVSGLIVCSPLWICMVLVFAGVISLEQSILLVTLLPLFLPMTLGLSRVVLLRINGSSIREVLREMGHPLCARCAYSLDGLELNSGPCPECGADLAQQAYVVDERPPNPNHRLPEREDAPRQEHA